MRIFLAGATGAIGRPLVPLLVESGHQVIGLTRRPDDAEALRRQGAEAVVADVYDAGALTRAMTEARPSVVMHQLTDLGRRDLQANADIRRRGTRNLVDAALAAGATRIIAQSISWAYEPGEKPADEETPLDLDSTGSRLVSVRGVAQLEAAVTELPEWVVLRYGMLYGPGTWYAKGALMDDLVRSGDLVPSRDISSFLHVEDAAAAAVQALDWPTGPVNIVDDEPAAATEWVPAFAASIGAPVTEVDPADRQSWARGADNRYARHDLGWSPRYPSWRTGFGN
ncbi:nucleoside-diphosphate-sugar epimerase [Kribbella voronezhensis]|uniref:Nucleoside-diphosphate-sugar epimerase n=1 Tax=Kribbella voronezhensis TaxID=2512212 RepID=A0A4R7THW2_9ACTN|nr:NAD(P)-dependent oxidoreductase [Kribbella voronezhensis]TDU91226.1 nucleoside-diphosphate-sugar epimerase [Kribbella voronezhensis]